MKHLLTGLTLCLAACASPAPPEPIVRTVEVQVPVPVSCVPADADLTAPDYPDTDAALLDAPDAAARYRLLYAGRALRAAFEAELLAVIEACRAD